MTEQPAAKTSSKPLRTALHHPAHFISTAAAWRWRQVAVLHCKMAKSDRRELYRKCVFLIQLADRVDLHTFNKSRPALRRHRSFAIGIEPFQKSALRRQYRSFASK
jgi:hypothetical protein